MSCTAVKSCHLLLCTQDDMCHLAVNKDKVFKDSWRMGAAILICTIFMVGEVVGGIYAHRWGLEVNTLQFNYHSCG